MECSTFGSSTIKSVIVCMTHAWYIDGSCCILRGLLTGKFKRGQVPDAKDSRIGWVEENKGARINQSHPSLAEYADKESFWALLDTMEKIGSDTGECTALHIIVNSLSFTCRWVSCSSGSGLVTEAALCCFSGDWSQDS